jgi:hypothetical protein
MLEVMNKLSAMGAQAPISYYIDSTRIAAVRRRYKDIDFLIKEVSKVYPRVPAETAGMASKAASPLDDVIFESIATLLASGNEKAGLDVWNRARRKYKFELNEMQLLSLLHRYRRTRTLPSQLLFRNLVDKLKENSLSNSPEFYAAALRLLQRFLDPKVANVRNFRRDLRMLHMLSVNASPFTKDGFPNVQYELVQCWLLASKLARRIPAKQGGPVKADMCLLEAFKLVDRSLNVAFDRAAAASGHKNKDAEDNDFKAGLPWTEGDRSVRNQKIVTNLLVELSALGRYDEMLKNMRKVLAYSLSLESQNSKDSFMSNGHHDYGFLVSVGDLVKGNLQSLSTIDRSIGRKAEPGPLAPALSEVVSKHSLYSPWPSAYISTPPASRSTLAFEGSPDQAQQWKRDMFSAVMRSAGQSILHNGSLNADEKLSALNGVVMRLISVAASYGLTLKDDFRAAWIAALPNVYGTTAAAVASNNAEVTNYFEGYDADEAMKYILGNVFRTYAVSSFSKSSRAGSNVLDAPISGRSIGAAIEYLCKYHEESRASTIVSIMEALRAAQDAGFGESLPPTTWRKLMDVVVGNHHARKPDAAKHLNALESALESCSVVSKHPELLKDILHMHIGLKNGPDAVHTLRAMRKAGISGDFSSYRGVIMALYQFKFQHPRDTKHLKLYSHPSDMINWIEREMIRDGVKIPAMFYADAMLLYVSIIRILTSQWNVNGSETPEHFPQVEAIVNMAQEFVRKSIDNGPKVNQSDEFVEASGRKAMLIRKVAKSGYDYHKDSTISDTASEGIASTHMSSSSAHVHMGRFKHMHKGVAVQRTLMLRRLLVVLCEAGKYSAAKELVKTVEKVYGVAPSADMYEVLFREVLLKGGHGDFTAAEGLLNEMQMLKIPINADIIACFGWAHLNRSDARDALDSVLELSNQYGVKPPPRLLFDILRHSLEQHDVIEARRVVMTIKAMKWDEIPLVGQTSMLGDGSESYEFSDEHHTKSGSGLASAVVKSIFSAFMPLRTKPSETSFDHDQASILRKHPVKKYDALSTESLRALFTGYGCDLEGSS